MKERITPMQMDALEMTSLGKVICIAGNEWGLGDDRPTLPLGTFKSLVRRGFVAFRDGQTRDHFVITQKGKDALRDGTRSR